MDTVGIDEKGFLPFVIGKLAVDSYSVRLPVYSLLGLK